MYVAFMLWHLALGRTFGLQEFSGDWTTTTAL